jgi:hypothetical protein
MDGAYEAGTCAPKRQSSQSNPRRKKNEGLARYAKRGCQPEDGHPALPNGIFVSVFIQTGKSL